MRCPALTRSERGAAHRRGKNTRGHLLTQFLTQSTTAHPMIKGRSMPPLQRLPRHACACNIIHKVPRCSRCLAVFLRAPRTGIEKSHLCLRERLQAVKMSQAAALQEKNRGDVHAQEEEEEEDCFESVEKLVAAGINAGDVKKLQEAGIYTCNGLMMYTKKTLCDIKGLSDAKVEKILEAAAKLVRSGYITGTEALTLRKQVVKITTGSKALDDLLGGGIETMAITEAFGEFRTGKTQLAHTLAVSTQLPTSMKGGNGKVALIDTEGTFRPERIVPIAERFGLDPNAVLDNIIFARAYTHEHQYQLLVALAAKMAEEPFRLLIIDSITALFRVDFTGRGELAERQQKLAQMLSRIMKIAEEFNIAVFLTNQVIADPGGGTFMVDPKKPAGGHVMAHASTIRLMFRKGKGEQRICKVIDSPSLPEAEATFAICNGGVVDAKD